MNKVEKINEKQLKRSEVVMGITMRIGIVTSVREKQ